MSKDLDRVADFLFELGMLKRTPRSGFFFLGSGRESVAEHSFRCAAIGYTLGKLCPEADERQVALICLFHDAAEARTGDLNYVHKKYDTADEPQAEADLTAGLPFGEELACLLQDFRQGDSLEVRLAKDADQLDLLCSLVTERDRGNRQADEWIPFLLERLQTDEGKALAESINSATSERWWFARKGSYWVKAEGPGGP